MAHRIRRTAAAAVAAPLIVLPLTFPATALAADAHPFGRLERSDSFSAYGTYGAYGAYRAYGAYGAYGSNGSYGGYGALPYGGPSTQSSTTADSEPATQDESTGVVLINTVVDYGSAQAAGTGLVLSSNGIVVTNHHVVEGSTSVTVTDPSTDRTYDARVIGYDAEADVAVLQLQGASGLQTVDPDTDGILAGEDVTAVGNAEGGGELIASDGDVTATGQDINVSDEQGGYESLSDLIQVDAYIVSGDSGGALLDADGEVVGMNVAASSGGYSVVGYAIPIDTVLNIAEQIVDGDASGDVVIGYGAALGVQLYSTTAGAYVAGVVNDSAAADAGVTSGSTITSIDGTSVSGIDDITAVLAQHEPGDSVRLTWTDASGTSHATTAVLGRAPLA